MDEPWAAPKTETSNVTLLTGTRGLWRWPVAGFVIVFVGMALVVTMYPMLPSGQAVIACPLWQYYLVEARRALTPAGGLGPASGSGSSAIVTALEHFVCSLIGGAVALGIGWSVRRLKSRS